MEKHDRKVWASVNNGEIDICSLVVDDLEAALNILDDSFFPRESVCIACDVDVPEGTTARLELRQMCRIIVEDGVSLVAKDVASGAVVAVAFNKIQCPPEAGAESFFAEFRDASTSSPQARALIDFMIDVDKEVDVFERFAIDCVCELTFLATLPQWERKGLGRSLAACTIDLARSMAQGVELATLHPHLRSRRPQAVSAIFTSVFSQKIGKDLGFRVLNSMPYTRFTYEGRTYDTRIAPQHSHCQHVVFMLL